jgi:hypothetical protein
MRLRRFAGVFACAAASLLTGCFQSSTLVKLNPDGSGTIEQTLSVATRLTALAPTEAEKKSAADELKQMFSVEQAKAAAAKMGPDVSFVSASKIDTPERTGLKSVYAFKDVRTLVLTVMNNPFDIDMGGNSEAPMSLAFTQLPNGHALLTIENDDMAAGMKPPTKLGPGGSTDDDETGKMIKAMLGGLKLDLTIQVGHLVKTNIPYVTGGAVTLASVDFDQLLANAAALDKLDKAQTMAEMKLALQGVKGFKVNLEPRLTIEFTK